MTFEEFEASEGEALQGPLLALWLGRRGEWAAAHEIVQEMAGRESAWVHAYLHRREGDRANAAYWYRQAGKPVAAGNLAVEWEQIVRTLLEG